MNSNGYLERRGELQAYFDRTAVEAWERLTSEAPVGRIRATVRQGRNEMRETLAGYLPADLSGRSILDAGCGTGALAVDLARRGASVVAIDLSPKLIGLARQRYAGKTGKGEVTFIAGDMLRPGRRFDHVVAMDSLIHYEPADMIDALAEFAAIAGRSVLITFVPRTPLLTMMHAIGRCFPRTNRSPALRPLGETAVRRLIAEEARLSGWRIGHTRLVSRGFYISQALELVRR